MKRFLIVLVIVLAMVPGIIFAGGQTEEGADEQVSMSLVVKNIGNPFFDVVKRGWDEACGELGVESIYRGPEQPTAEGQIEIIKSLIAQRVNGITYVANDPQSLVGVAKKAMEQGIKINGWESGVVEGGRNVSTEPVSAKAIGVSQVKMMYEMLDGKGQIAILSAASTMENQNTWIEYMKEELAKPEYKDMELVTVVYGDDVREKSYNEALGLFKSYPDLRGIIAPTSVGIAAAGRAITDEGLIDQVELTGTGLPSEMYEYVNNGACKKFGLWNPADLGYLNAYVTYNLIQGKITGKAGETFDAGKLGSYTIEEQPGVSNGVIFLGDGLMEFNAGNIDEFKDVL